MVESFAQLKVLSKQLSVLDQRPAFGKSRWKEEICCLKTAATGWKMKKALLQAQGLILRANHVEDVNPGK